MHASWNIFPFVASGPRNSLSRELLGNNHCILYNSSCHGSLLVYIKCYTFRSTILYRTAGTIVRESCSVSRPGVVLPKIHFFSYSQNIISIQCVRRATITQYIGYGSSSKCIRIDYVWAVWEVGRRKIYIKP